MLPVEPLSSPSAWPGPTPLPGIFSLREEEKERKGGKERGEKEQERNKGKKEFPIAPGRCV